MQEARLKHLSLKYSVVFDIRNGNASVFLRFFFTSACALVALSLEQ